MHFFFNNVNDAFRQLVRGYQHHDIEGAREALRKSSSRNGDVVKAIYPTTITYKNPTQRVLFNPVRDCNPFFHLYESLWMLAGRNDIAPLVYYNSGMANYSDDGTTQNGAYGYRWRHATRLVKHPGMQAQSELILVEHEVDQIHTLLRHLHQIPNTRRAVLDMWNVQDDLGKIDSSKDVCCNLSVKFSIREEWEDLKGPHGNSTAIRYLDMTVFNRSNDLVWGALGANVVHFSILQEYMAAHLGVDVGVYNQIADDLHVYLNDKWKPDEWAKADIDYYNLPVSKLSDKTIVGPTSLVKDPAQFDKELPQIVHINKNGEVVTQHEQYDEPFFKNVAQPMFHAFHCHKQRDYKAAWYWLARMPMANDWKEAAVAWINKREEMWMSRKED